MSASHSSRRLLRAARQSGLCSCFPNGFRSGTRSISTSQPRMGVPTFHSPTRKDGTAGESNLNQATTIVDTQQQLAQPSYKQLSSADRAAQAAQRARAKMLQQQEKYSATRQLGGLASDNVFHDEDGPESQKEVAVRGDDLALRERNISAMSLALNPRPNARARWQRKMVIRHVRQRGRLPKKVQIDRSERYHLAKSHFFKTSMKKLAPLARQISGKSIDEAILQMRFSKKKAAIDVREHLIQARDEAVVLKGMGLAPASQQITAVGEVAQSTDSAVILDPAISPPAAHQHPTKTQRPDVATTETNIYIAQAWVNRGPYGMEPEYRARGRVNILRPPWTGISVLLKEEKTRTREKAEKEEKSIRKRLGKTMWTQLPDRPIIRQSQYVLW